MNSPLIAITDGIEGETPPPIPIIVEELFNDHKHQLNLRPAQTALSKYNVLDNDSKNELHLYFHSSMKHFTIFATGLNFVDNELLYLKMKIETEHSKSCNICGNRFDVDKYKCIEKQNCDKIDKYFKEILPKMVHKHHQKMMKVYKEKSIEKYKKLLNGYNDNNNYNDKESNENLEIQFNSIESELSLIFDECYKIIDHNLPQAPNINVINGESNNLEILILDDKKENDLNDQYKVLINNKEYEYQSNTRNILNIADILPLSEYTISLSRHQNNHWSEYSKQVNIFTDFKLLWSKIHHGTNTYFKKNDKYIYCQSNKGDSTIICDNKYLISSTLFKQITFSFNIKQFAQYSYFGFIEYDLNILNNINWNKLIIKNENSYILGCCNGYNQIQRFIKGVKEQNIFGYTKYIKLHNSNKIKNGDEFLFVINFDLKTCSVYVNKICDENKVSVHQNEYTFHNIPNSIIPIYSHSDNLYVKAHTKVAISIKNYILRTT